MKTEFPFYDEILLHNLLLDVYLSLKDILIRMVAYI